MSADPEPQTEAIDPVGHIVRTPGTVGGRPRIAGTRIRVAHIAGWYIEGGMSIAEMLVQFPALSEADIHAALAYYFDHRPEIESQEREDAEFAETFLSENPDIARRAGG